MRSTALIGAHRSSEAPGAEILTLRTAKVGYAYEDRTGEAFFGLGNAVVKHRKSAGSQTRPTDETGASTSERLLDTAARLFWTKGYAATTTREIAALLGVQKASLYHHVSRKEDLLYEICVASLRHIQDTVEAALAGVPDPLERIRALIRAHVAAMLVDQHKHSTMLTELRALSKGRRDEVVALRDIYEAFVRSVLDTAQRAGAIRSDVPVKYLALSLLDLMNWAIFWFQPDGGISPEQLGEFFVTIYLAGVSQEPTAARAVPSSEAGPSPSS